MSLKCYFIIEKNIAPREVKSEEAHQAILGYLKAIADKPSKNVSMTPEMEAEVTLLEK